MCIRDSSIVTQLNEAVWKLLQHTYMPVPTTQKWNEISESFYDICKMPHCIGSLDGKHCSIICPSKAGSQYYNYKHFHSIVLMAIADPNSNFITCLLYTSYLDHLIVFLIQPLKKFTVILYAGLFFLKNIFKNLGSSYM